MFTEQIQALCVLGYETSTVQRGNLETAFELINDDKVTKANLNRWNAREYFHGVAGQSKELFVLSNLACRKALLRTFGHIHPRQALDWFRNQSVPPRLTLLTQLYFLDQRKTIPQQDTADANAHSRSQAHYL